jgi:uncharacterized protein
MSWMWLRQVALALVCAVVLPVWAQTASTPVDAGLAALDRGHFATAMRAWREAADAGDARAQSNVGYLYERGFGVPQSYVEAQRWYHMAAAQGLAEAQFNIGTLYKYGYGVEANPREANSWFRMAAKQELPAAQYMLGLSYSKGEGVPKSAVQALKLWVAAAAKGHLSSQLMAGHAYLAGEAQGEPDRFKAYVWGSVAAERGNEDAALVRDYASYQMDEDDIARAQAAAKVCRESAYARCPAL